MQVANKIDLIYFSQHPSSPGWDAGNSLHVADNTKDFFTQVHNHLSETKANWLLFWDFKAGEPDKILLQELVAKPVDIWHAGLKFGLMDKPDVLNYVHPTWMYNKDASSYIEHSSFRLSLYATLIRTSVLKGIFLDTPYASFEMMGLALGYRAFKSGAIIRYHPELVKSNLPEASIPLADEWRFAVEFFSMKWQIWTLLNKPGNFKNFLSWRSIKAVSHSTLKPAIHSSKKQEREMGNATVSVLAPTLNRYSYLLNELEQLSKQTVLPYEVLITDQTKKEDRVNLDFNDYPNLTVRYFPQNETGQCIAWNKLLEEAKGEYVLFLGDDADDIKPDFIEKLLTTQKKFDADMVASNVIEAGITYGVQHEHYYISDTFPITLIKRDLLLKVGFLDMFFNKNIRADHDLAMRCHLAGALMIFDSSATIYHHRAPVGGLRTHNARAVTSSMAKKSVNKFLNPTSSEIYLVKKYYNTAQFRNYIKIKYFNQLFITGNIIKKFIRLLLFIGNIPTFYKYYKMNEKQADNQLKKNKEHLHTVVSRA